MRTLTSVLVIMSWECQTQLPHSIITSDVGAAVQHLLPPSAALWAEEAHMTVKQ